PGLVKMLEMAHQTHGKAPWADLFQPAIRLAEQGFEISPRLHLLLAKVPQVARREAIKAYFYNKQSQPKAVGTVLRNPAYAQSLRDIAAEGSTAFYQGDIARKLVATVNGDAENPGSLSLQDLRNYQVKKRPGLCRPYRQYRVCSMGPPSSGGVAVLQILGMLEHFDLAALAPNSAPALHLFAEAAKRAYADRDTYLADTDFVNVPINGLLDAAYLKQRSADISAQQASKQVQPGRFAALQYHRSSSLEFPSTTHLSIIDGSGMAVSMTSSIETAFGSRLMSSGFLLNNQLTDFSFLPVHNDVLIANRVEAGKRPRSSMSPTMVFDAEGNPLLIIGSPGGSRIINYVALNLIRVLDWQLPIDVALAAGQAVQMSGGLELENGRFSAATISALQERGHAISSKALNSGLHAIQRLPDGKLIGAADPRREGVAAGH
ncbi:MAG: gamma-glutamyltransferase family protein, partial [Pseudomonadales bacterium]